MPVYEFHCLDCDTVMTEIRNDSNDRAARCPRCGSMNTQRLIPEKGMMGEHGHRVIPCVSGKGG